MTTVDVISEAFIPVLLQTKFLSYVRFYQDLIIPPTLFHEILAKIWEGHIDHSVWKSNIRDDKNLLTDIIKKSFAKLCWKTHLKRDKILQLALCILVIPRTRIGWSHYEIIYRRPLLAPKNKKRNVSNTAGKIKQYVQQTGQLLTTLHTFVFNRSPPCL